MNLALAAENRQTILRQIPRADLCVTEGTVEQLPDQRLSVNAPKMCAYVNVSRATVHLFRCCVPATRILLAPK